MNVQVWCLPHHTLQSAIDQLLWCTWLLSIIWAGFVPVNRCRTSTVTSGSCSLSVHRVVKWDSTALADLSLPESLVSLQVLPPPWESEVPHLVELGGGSSFRHSISIRQLWECPWLAAWRRGRARRQMHQRDPSRGAETGEETITTNNKCERAAMVVKAGLWTVIAYSMNASLPLFINYTTWSN